MEFEKYDINYDNNDSVDKKINNIFEFFINPIKTKKPNLFTKENIKGIEAKIAEQKAILNKILEDMSGLNEHAEKHIEKRNNLLSMLGNNVQTVITTTDIENITEDIWKKASIYKIDDGNIVFMQKNNEDGEVNGK